jgi:hypothetical protein
MSDENLSSLPHPFNKMKMGRYNEFRKIVPNVPFDTFKPDVIDGTTWSLPGSVESRTKRLPCLTTPALWSDGRDEPKRSGKQASATAKKRWAEDNRKYGPWAYETDAMLHDNKNNLRHVTANEAESLHHFPSEWTSSTNADENTRLRLIGNAWHAGVAKLMWVIVLLCPTLPRASTTSTHTHERFGHPQGCKHHGVYSNIDLCTPPLREQRELPSELQPTESWQDELTRSPRLRPIEEAISWFRASGTLPGPWPQDRCTIAVHEQDDPMRHLQQAIEATHPDSNRRHLDPSIGFALSAQKMLRHRIIEYRSQIATDIDLLVEQMADETEAWKNTLQPHVLAAYSHKDAPNGITQIPVLLQLMEWMQLPDVEVWHKELTSGFKMMGKLTPGLGWKKRTDSHYASPMSLDEFRSLNKANILKCIRRKPDTDSNSMLKEITDEVDKGRMSGPYKAPPIWNAKTVAPDGRKLLPLPAGDVFIANAFAIHQIGSDDKKKVRRGEDWRRSFHNSTVEVDDAPYHHNIESYAALATANLETWSDGEMPALKIWGQDHEGAYRQLPLENTREAFVHLIARRQRCAYPAVFTLIPGATTFHINGPVRKPSEGTPTSTADGDLIVWLRPRRLATLPRFEGQLHCEGEHRCRCEECDALRFSSRTSCSRTTRRWNPSRRCAGPRPTLQRRVRRSSGVVASAPARCRNNALSPSLVGTSGGEYTPAPLKIYRRRRR